MDSDSDLDLKNINPDLDSVSRKRGGFGFEH